MNGDLFTDIFSALQTKEDHLADQDNDPVALDEEQKIAGLNFLFSDATNGMRYGEHLHSYKALVTEFVNAITEMNSFQQVTMIDDSEIIEGLNTWIEGDSWKVAKSGWIHLNLHLGNFTRIKFCLDGINHKRNK